MPPSLLPGCPGAPIPVVGRGTGVWGQGTVSKYRARCTAHPAAARTPEGAVVGWVGWDVSAGFAFSVEGKDISTKAGGSGGGPEGRKAGPTGLDTGQRRAAQMHAVEPPA